MPKSQKEKFSKVDHIFCMAFVRAARKIFPTETLAVVTGTYDGITGLYLNVDGERAKAPYNTWIVWGTKERMDADALKLNEALAAYGRG